MRKVVFIFGRFQTPTKGHEEMIRYGAGYARKIGAEFRVYTSKSFDVSKNPLPYQQKIHFLQKLFPGVRIVDDPNVKTAFDICRQLSDAGIEDVTMITGSDRVNEFQRSIGKYVMPHGPTFDPKKNYAFKNFQVISSGGRKAGVSGTQMREYIRTGKFSEFLKTAPTKDRTLAREIFNAAKAHLREDFQQLNEEKGVSRKEFDKILKNFVDYTCKHLSIKEAPSLHYKDDKGEGQPSFGGYAPGEKKLYVYTKNRHPMDILRTVAHELVHHKQNEDGRLGKDIAKEGATGSDIENEANSEAGKVMRYYGRENPFYFDMNYVMENRAIIFAGSPGSGKDRILKEAILPFGFTEISADSFHKAELKEQLIVVNGTGNDIHKTRIIKEALELRGYKTMMVFVNTTNEVSKLRNESRLGKGRVITESVRFNKWKDAQFNATEYAQMFEHYAMVNNSIDLDNAKEYEVGMHRVQIRRLEEFVSKFIKNDADTNFENMLNEVGGAGNWGTSKLTDRYKADTPGEKPGGFKSMKVLDTSKRDDKGVPSNAKAAPMPRLPIGADRIGPEYGFPKEPSFGDNQTMPFTTINDPIGRWMVKEETRKKFKEKYGKLAEQKLRETAIKLVQHESLDDPFSSFTGATPNAWEAENQRPMGASQTDAEKQSLFGIHLKKQRKNRKTK